MAQQCRASQIAQGKVQFPTRAALVNQVKTQDQVQIDEALCFAIKGVEEAIYQADDSKIPVCRFNDQSFIFISDLVRLFTSSAGS